MLQSIPGAGEHPGLSALQNAVICNLPLRLIVFSALRAFALSRSKPLSIAVLLISLAPFAVNAVGPFAAVRPLQFAAHDDCRIHKLPLVWGVETYVDPIAGCVRVEHIPSEDTPIQWVNQSLHANVR